MSEINKILIIRLSSFGDIVLTYPFISRLREVFPNAQLDFLTKERFLTLVKMHNGINDVKVYKGETISDLRNMIKKNNYDLIFDLHKNIRSVFSTFIIHPEKVRYKKGTLKKLLFVAFKINLMKCEIPVYKRYLFALHNIHFLENLDYKISELNFNKVPFLNEPYILIAPASKHYTKTLPKEKFEQIIKGIRGKKIVIIGDNSKQDEEICNYLSGISDRVIDFCGKSDFTILANLIYNSELVICNDSGVLHLAESLNKKTVVFFGSTVREFGFYPQLESTIIFENYNLKCRPCTHIGKASCPKKHFKCMNEININEAIKIIDENLS